VEEREAGRGLSREPVGVGEQAEEVRTDDLRSGRTPRGEPVAEVLRRGRAPLLLDEGPAAEHVAIRGPERESLIDRYRDGARGAVEGEVRLAAELIDRRRHVERERRRERMSDAVRELERAIRHPRRLVGSAEMPEDDRTVGQARDAGILAVEERVRRMDLAVVQCRPRLEVRHRVREIAAEEEGRPERTMRFDEERRIADGFGEPEEAAAEVVGRSHVATHQVERPETEQRREELRRLTDLAAEL